MKEISLPKIEQPVSNETSIREQQRNKRHKNISKPCHTKARPSFDCFSLRIRVSSLAKNRYPILFCRKSQLTYFKLEIYRIVSSKALDQGEGGQNVLGGERKVLEISKSADTEAKKGNCC
jgi:hypothetical protein